jgi:hypothetical protein
MWVGRYAVPHHQHYTNYTDDHTAPRQTITNNEQTQQATKGKTGNETPGRSGNRHHDPPRNAQEAPRRARRSNSDRDSHQKPAEAFTERLLRLLLWLLT